MIETDLYPPIKTFLESQGYEVKSEVNGCDMMGVRNDEDPVVIELKLILNLPVILQAVDRLKLTDKVYVGIPGKAPLLKKKKKQVLKLFRMLGLGLIVVEPDKNRRSRRPGSVDVLCDPGPYQPRKSRFHKDRLLREFMQRVGDPNLGGTASRKGIMTAYRQKALGIGRFLEENGPTKASEVAAALSEPKTRSILYRNVYGWFERAGHGIYQLAPRGEKEMPLWLDSVKSKKKRKRKTS